MSNFPSHWVTTKGTTVFEFVTSGSRGWAQHYASTGAKFIRIGNLDHGSITLDLRDVQHVNPPSGAEGERTRLRPNDVLISITAELGMVGVVPAGFGEAYINQHIALARPRPDIHAKFVAWYFASDADGKKALRDMGRGGTKVGLGLDDIRNADVPLAPLPEQQRIADKLDTVLARVDAVNDRLARVAPLLKRFRQSVLAAATSGRLTADWRGADAFAVYPKRRLAEFGSARLGKMLDKQKNTGIETRYLRNVNVRWFGFDLSDLQNIRIEPHERETLQIVDGDLLICEGGEPGRCAVWNKGSTDIVFQKALHRVRVDSTKALPTWIAYALKSLCDSAALDDLFTGTTIKHLTGVALTQVDFPMPSSEEQYEIVRRLDILFAFADRLEVRLQAARTAASRLTPTLLAKAFRGELVPQDPADEPAAELLRRLAARSSTPAKRTRAKQAS